MPDTVAAVFHAPEPWQAWLHASAAQKLHAALAASVAAPLHAPAWQCPVPREAPSMPPHLEQSAPCCVQALHAASVLTNGQPVERTRHMQTQLHLAEDTD